MVISRIFRQVHQLSDQILLAKGKIVSSHLTENQVEAFCRRTLAATELLRVDDHLVECDSCRQRLAQAEFLPHLSFEQTADFVDGRLAGETLQMASDHLASCDLCREAVDDLQHFSREIADGLSREVQPATAEAESFWQRVREFFTPQSQVVVYSTALALLIAGMWLARQFVFKKDNQQVAVTNPTPTEKLAASPSPEIRPVKLLAQLNDGGGSLALDERGALLGADNLPADYQQLLKQVLASPRLERPATLNGLGSPSASLMGGGAKNETFAVIEPVGKVSLTDRPTLRWQPLAGATHYEVEVFDEGFNSVLKSGQLETTSWRLPQALARGRVYAWQVKAIKKGQEGKDGQEIKAPQPPAPLARFRVLAKKEADEIEQARAQFASSHLLLGRLYAEAGLLDEAEREFRELQKANPDSEVVKRLLRELRKFRR